MRTNRTAWGAVALLAVVLAALAGCSGGRGGPNVSVSGFVPYGARYGGGNQGAAPAFDNGWSEPAGSRGTNMN